MDQITLISNYLVCKMKILMRLLLKIHTKYSFPMAICWQRTQPRMESSTQSTHQVRSSTNHTFKTPYQSTLVRRKSWWTNNTIINSILFWMRGRGSEVANRHQLPATSCDQHLPLELCYKAVANHGLLPKSTGKDSNKTQEINTLKRWIHQHMLICQSRCR